MFNTETLNQIFKDEVGTYGIQALSNSNDIYFLSVIEDKEFKTLVKPLNEIIIKAIEIKEPLFLGHLFQDFYQEGCLGDIEKKSFAQLGDGFCLMIDSLTKQELESLKETYDIQDDTKVVNFWT